MRPWQRACDGLLRAFSGFSEQIGAVIQRAAESSPSIAYEPLLIKLGVKPVWARGLARLTIRSGRRRANESVRLLDVVDAIRVLAKPGRSRRAILRKAEVLLAAWQETSVILSIPPGPKLSAASAAHQFLLQELVSATGGQGYTWNSYIRRRGRFFRPLTRATRLEFARPV
jgi:hypothetical protein